MRSCCSSARLFSAFWRSAPASKIVQREVNATSSANSSDDQAVQADDRLIHLSCPSSRLRMRPVASASERSEWSSSVRLRAGDSVDAPTPET